MKKNHKALRALAFAAATGLVTWGGWAAYNEFRPGTPAEKAAQIADVTGAIGAAKRDLLLPENIAKGDSCFNIDYDREGVGPPYDEVVVVGGNIIGTLPIRIEDASEGQRIGLNLSCDVHTFPQALSIVKKQFSDAAAEAATAIVNTRMGGRKGFARVEYRDTQAPLPPCSALPNYDVSDACVMQTGPQG